LTSNVNNVTGWSVSFSHFFWSYILARISRHSLSKQGKRGKAEFIPDLKEWTQACKLYAYDKQIFEHFDICAETFYRFLDKQRFEHEEGRPSEYIDAYKAGRAEKRAFALTNLLQLAKKGDPACSIFVAKSFGQLLEAKDQKHIDLKKKELELKTRTFLTSLAEKFSLNVEELQSFADKHFTDKNLNDI
jgi:hypothetical protein